ncbi:MAG TPA: hypothetical protein GXZ90_06135 [Clostridiales bacterium]|nr:hypothetical protein [Clostridiales bacterium]
MRQISIRANNNNEDTKYIIKQNKNNQSYISHYDEEYRKQINIYCNPSNNDGTECIKKALDDLYLSKFNI